MEGMLVAGLAGKARPRGQVRFHADDGLDAAGAGFLVEGDCPVQGAVVGEADSLLAQLPRPFHQLRDASKPVQEAVFAVKVKVSKHLRFSGDTYYSAAAAARINLMLIWREFWGGLPYTIIGGGPAHIPPSTGRATPVMKDASSEARKRIAAATSSGRPMRPMG